MKISGLKLGLATCVAGMIAIAAISFRNYWGGLHRSWDDYATISAVGTGSSMEGGRKLTEQTYNSISRFQPVRLYSYSLAIHLVPEEATFAAIFAMHLINTILLFALVRKFNVGNLLAFLAATQFCIYAVPRHIYSISNTLGGSGLCTLFLLIATISLINGIQSGGWKRYAHMVISWLAYGGMAYSYETAFPMIMVIVFTWAMFFYFLPRQPIFSRPARIILLLPYFAILASYILFFYRGQSSYPGAQVSVSGDSLVRLASYVKVMLANIKLWPVHADVWSIVATIIFAAVIAGVILLARKDRPPADALKIERRPGIIFALSGLLWYSGGVCLFTINQWNSPTDVYWGHLYLMTPGASIFLVSLLPLAAGWIRGKAAGIVAGVLLIAVLPLINNEVSFNLAEGLKELAPGRIWSTVRQDIKRQVDPEKIDAVLVKNLLEPQGRIYCRVSDMDGALLEWFGFKKRIFCGDNIVSCRDGKIALATPLSCYKFSERTGVQEVENSRTEILYYDSDSHHVLPYGDQIDVPAGKNLFQLRQVRLEYTAHSGPLEAIVRMPVGAKWLTVTMDSPQVFDNVEKIFVRVNDRPITAARRAGGKLSLDVSQFGGCKYLFLHLNDPDRQELRNYLVSIGFADSAVGNEVALAAQNATATTSGLETAVYNRMYWMNGDYPFFNAQKGWKFYDASWRKAVASPAAFSVKLPSPPSDVRRCSLAYCIFNFHGANPQRIRVCLNGVELENYIFSCDSPFGDKRRCSFPVELIKVGQDNVVEFFYENASGDATSGADGFLVSTFGFEVGQADQWPAWGSEVEYSSQDNYISFGNWHTPESGFRWADGASGVIRLRCPPSPDKSKDVKLKIHGFGLGDQQLVVLFNGRQIGKTLCKGRPTDTAMTFSISPEIYKGGDFNEIEFRVPGAKQASKKDDRILGFAFQNLSLTVE